MTSERLLSLTQLVVFPRRFKGTRKLMHKGCILQGLAACIRCILRHAFLGQSIVQILDRVDIHTEVDQIY